MLDDIKARLVEKIPDLAGSRLQGATEFAEVINSNTIPTAEFFGYVTLGGMNGGPASASTGQFTQPVRNQIGVTLGFHTHSRTAEAALNDISDRVMNVIEALCGWAPPDALGVFHLENAQMAGFQRGAVFYQINLSIGTQLRITP